MEIKKNKSKVYIKKGDLHSETWNNVSKHHLYKYFRKVISHLKSRGFVVDVPQYFIDNDWGYTTHKIAKKQNGVVVLLELNNRVISLNFTDDKNVWENEQSCWDKYDDRHTKLSYLGYKAIELEIKRLVELFPRAIFEEEVVLEGEDLIINCKKESWHSNDKEKLDELGLDGVVYQMSEYDLKHNNKDRNGKQIECGETKFFYDCDNRLKKGSVYHNLNNMWWVLSGDKVRNKASFELFNYEGQPKRKPLKKEEKINRLQKELRKFEKSKEYLRCIEINKQIEKLGGSGKMYKVYSLKWGSWWRANSAGYTTNEDFAGLYTEENILANQSYYNDGEINKAVEL